MRVADRIKLLVALAVVVTCGSGLCCASSGQKTTPTTDLCDVLRNPSRYAGKTITVIARVTSTKDGGFLWSPSCSKRGVRMIIDLKPESGNSAAEFLAALRKYGLSDRPVIATLTGVYVADYHDEIRNRRYPAFRITAAANVRRSRHVERP